MEAKIKEIPFKPSTIETIDQAVFNFFDNGLNIFCDTNKGWEKVKVLWVGQERSFQVKHDEDMRDSIDNLILPIITVERESFNKSLSKKGTVIAGLEATRDAKGGTSITIARHIQQDKTQNFANADSYRLKTDSGNKQINFPHPPKKVVYETIMIPIPVYLEVMYKIGFQSEYQQQMNDMLSPIATITGGLNSLTITHDNHRFEAFLEEAFESNNNTNNPEDEERSFKTFISLRVLGYIIGSDKNQMQPKYVIRENAVQIRTPRERSVVGDSPEHIDEFRKYFRQ